MPYLKHCPLNCCKYQTFYCPLWWSSIVTHFSYYSLSSLLSSVYVCVLYVYIESVLLPSSVSMHHHIYFSPPVLCCSRLSHKTRSKILAEAFTLSAFYFPPVPGFESPIFSIIPQTLSQVPHCQCKQDNLMRQSALNTDTRTVLWKTINCNMSSFFFFFMPDFLAKS